MNKNSYSNVDHWSNIIYPPATYTGSLGYLEIIPEAQKKEKTMDHYKEFPFHCEWQSFKTLAEATVFARKQVMNSKEDVVIKQNVAIVKFPVPDYEVETLSV